MSVVGTVPQMSWSCWSTRLIRWASWCCWTSFTATPPRTSRMAWTSSTARTRVSFTLHPEGITANGTADSSTTPGTLSGLTPLSTAVPSPAWTEGADILRYIQKPLRVYFLKKVIISFVFDKYVYRDWIIPPTLPHIKTQASQAVSFFAYLCIKFIGIKICCAMAYF